MYIIDNNQISFNEKTKISNFDRYCTKFFYLDKKYYDMFNDKSNIIIYVNDKDIAYKYKIRNIMKFKSVVKEEGVTRYISVQVDNNTYHDDLFDVFCYHDPSYSGIEKFYSRVNKIRSFV